MPARKPDQRSRQITFALDDDLRDTFYNYLEAEGCATISEGVRSLLRIALAATPQEGAAYAARMRAFSETRNWAIERLNIALGEMRRDLQAALPSDLNRPAASPPGGTYEG